MAVGEWVVLAVTDTVVVCFRRRALLWTVIVEVAVVVAVVVRVGVVAIHELS
jgi:hypothetical protein